MSSNKIQIVAIFYGGYGPEFDISYQSAQFVQSVLHPIGWQLYLVEVSKSGYRVFDAHNQLLAFDEKDYTIIKNGKKHKVDVVFNSIHGSPGEDGKLAKLLDQYSIPHTSCSEEVAKLTFDKHDCLSKLEEIGIHRPRYCFLDTNVIQSSDLVELNVGFPCFVKPARSGSSFGISRVDHKSQLKKALKQASALDERLLIEQALKGIEVSVGVVAWKGEILVLPITELVSHNPFFDYQAKYLGKSEEITPARISTQVKKKLGMLAKRIYLHLGLKGATRSEFIIENETIYLLEVNTVPGFTQVSILPQQLQAAGIDLTEFFGHLVKQAVM